MPRLHGYRDRVHQPLWDTLVMSAERNYDRGALQIGLTSGVLFISDRKAGGTQHVLDLWDVVLDYGELVIGAAPRVPPHPYRMD